MEKRTPHHPLAAIKAAVAARGLVAFTGSAQAGILDMGLSFDQALLAIAALDRRAFFKSMTTLADHTVWQDVYHAPTPHGVAYVKFTLRGGAVVISFKRL